MEEILGVCSFCVDLGVQHTTPPEPVTLVDLQIQEGGALL